jgi:hypothetical protein
MLIELSRGRQQENLRQLAAQTGLSVVTVLEKLIELFLAADEAKENLFRFRTDRMRGH